MLACPVCGSLQYADHLQALASAAREATDRGDLPTALAHWREALPYLPPQSKQYQIVSGKITELGSQVPAGAVAKSPNQSTMGKAASGLGAIGLLLWKLKVLLLGFGKASTFLSMLVSVWIYAKIWGWPFAVGFVLSIYVHEMGHVIALRRLGFKATAPMFIPGLGALIRLKQQVINPKEDAEIGLAGPIYGLGAAVFTLGVWAVINYEFHRNLLILKAIAGVGAWINLFNLFPIWTLDGGRGFHAMSQVQKFLAAITVATAWFCTGQSFATRDGMLLLIALVCAGRAISDQSEPLGNWKATLTYMVLVILLTAVSLVRPPHGI
jgi:Zn-dependent protease